MTVDQIRMRHPLLSCAVILKKLPTVAQLVLYTFYSLVDVVPEDQKNSLTILDTGGL